ncbi:MAG: porin family protein [Flavisolibacter sp.]
MKKISLFFLALSAGVAMRAQHHQLTTEMTVAPRFGVKAGVNLAEFKESGTSSTGSLDNVQNRTSFHAGLLYNLPLASMFRLQPELYYSGQGSKLSSTYTQLGTTTTNTADMKLNYINLPVLLQLQTVNGFYVELGPQLGYLTSAKLVPTNGSEQDVKNQLRKTDFSAAGGIGYLSRVGLGIDARYVYGFRNIYNSDYSGNAGRPEIKNRVIQIGLIYQFGAGQ